MVSSKTFSKIFFVSLILLFVVLTSYLLVALVELDIKIQIDYIPTMLNGLVSSISIVSGLLVAIVILSLREKEFNLIKSTKVVVFFSATWIVASVSLLLIVYHYMLRAEYITALIIVVAD